MNVRSDAPLNQVDFDIDVDHAWTITQGMLRRRSRWERLRRIAVFGCIVLVVGVVARAVDRDSSSLGVIASEAQEQFPAELRTPSGTVAVDTRVHVEAPESLVAPAGEGTVVSAMLRNATKDDFLLGTGPLAFLHSYVSDADGKVVGGSAAGFILAGPAKDYGMLAAGATMEIQVRVAAVGIQYDLSQRAEPLNPGSYLLWIALPTLEDAERRVAGPVALTIE